MITGLFNSGAMPALERVVQFTQARHQVLADNIANLSTPYFKPKDLDPQSFQTALREAIDHRRSGANPTSAPLEPADTRELRFQSGRLEVHPQATNQGILFHDQNNRDLERTMQHLAENTVAHNTAVELMRNEFSMIATAIRERV